MKRLKILLFVLLFCTGALFAQKGLHVGELFNSLTGNPKATVTCIKGGALKQYKMSLFYSVTVSGDPELTSLIESTLAKDARKAVDRQVQYKNGKLRYAFYKFGTSSEGLNRYALFSNDSKTVLIYIEGKVHIEGTDANVVESLFK